MDINEYERREAALKRAERMALISTMASKVAHEIRTPLGSITLNLDLMNLEISRLTEAAGDSAEEGRVLIKEMRTEAGNIQKILEEYLQFARALKPRRQLLDLNALLEQKLPLLHPELELAKVGLRTQFDPALGMVNIDPDQLWQMVSHLIRNSREATTGGGEIVIKTSRADGQVVLQVRDHGSGMTAEQLAHLFEPFFTTKYRGTGMGLALVQQIVTAHGGRIDCESAVGAGTTFTLSLPLTATVTPAGVANDLGITSALTNSNHA
jgi:signal transduction histidine kinase